MRFATEEWAQAFRAEIEASSAYRKAGAGWRHGPIVLVVRAAPALGISSPVYLWLDLSGGHCQQARLVTLIEADRAPFCIEGDYADWKAIVQRRLDPIKAILTRKLSLRGSKLTILRYVPAALALVDCALQVPVEFADDEKSRA